MPCPLNVYVVWHVFVQGKHIKHKLAPTNNTIHTILRIAATKCFRSTFPRYPTCPNPA